MTANESFFVRRKAAAAFNHGIPAHYPPVFLNKAGSVAGGRVVFLDGYAGQGRYDDGTPGSPLLFVQTARKHPNHRVTGIFVERDSKRYAHLCGVLAEADPDGEVVCAYAITSRMSTSSAGPGNGTSRLRRAGCTKPG